MKRLLFILAFIYTTAINAQCLNCPNGITAPGAGASPSVKFNGYTSEVKYYDGIKPTCYTPTANTLNGHLQGINNRLCYLKTVIDSLKTNDSSAFAQIDSIQNRIDSIVDALGQFYNTSIISPDSSINITVSTNLTTNVNTYSLTVPSIDDSARYYVDSLISIIDTQQQEIEQLWLANQYYAQQINYILSHLYDCCDTVPVVENPFTGTTVSLCSEDIQGRITYTLDLTTIGGITLFSVTQKMLSVPTAIPNTVTSITNSNMIVPSSNDMRIEIADISNTQNKFILNVQYTQSAVVKTGQLIFSLPNFIIGVNTCVSDIPSEFVSTWVE